jgi:hypothetical protein
MCQEYKAVDSYNEFTVHSSASPVITVIISVTVDAVKRTILSDIIPFRK